MSDQSRQMKTKVYIVNLLNRCTETCNTMIKISLYLWFTDLAISAVTCLKSGFSLCSHFNRENRLCPWNATDCLSKSLSMFNNTFSLRRYTHSNLKRKTKRWMLLTLHYKVYHKTVEYLASDTFSITAAATNLHYWQCKFVQSSKC